MDNKKALKTIVISIIGNTLLALVKLAVGIVGNSFALIADAIESTSDIFSSTMVWIGLKISNKPADSGHPYGHGKIEPLITFVVVAFLISSAVIITIQAIKNIQTPHELPAWYTLVFLAGIIATKEGYYRYVNRKSVETKSSSLKADAWHHRSDAITSLAAFIGIAVALIMGKGYETADDWAALVASAIILYNSYLIFRPALGELLDEQQYDELKERIKIMSKEVEGVIDTEKCYIRKQGMYFYVDLHVIVADELTVQEGHRVAHRLKEYIKQQLPEIYDVLTHVEPLND